MCDAGGCGIAVWFGAHIARTDLWQPFNGTTGATTIPGSPYHVALAKLDGGSIGNRDNQMQANAIVPQLAFLRSPSRHWVVLVRWLHGFTGHRRLSGRV
jgi:hypothetical protein